MTPIECRTRNLNYETEIKVNINYWKVDIINLQHSPQIIPTSPKYTCPDVLIGSLPVMVKSKWCILAEKLEHQDFFDLD